MEKRENGFISILSCIIILFVFGLIITQIKSEEEYGTKQGKIIDKKYHTAYTSIVYSSKVMIPTYHPASYRICIQKDINGELKSIWIDVDSDTYRELNIGDYYNREEERNGKN